MEDKNFKNGIQEIKKIIMTADEKKQIFENILNTPVAKDVKVQGSWFSYLFISKISKMRLAYYAVIPLVIIVTGGGVVFASEASLPDNILYPVKVNIVEPIRGALTFSTKAKANYESDLATKRMVEAETLAIEGKLDTKEEEKINILLEKHNKKLNEAIDKIEEKDKPEQVNEIVIDFQTKMNAHAKVLDIITSKNLDKEERREKQKEDKRDKPKLDDVEELKIDDSDFKMDTFSAVEIKREDVKERKVNQISVSARINAENIGSRSKTKHEDKREEEDEDRDKDKKEPEFKDKNDINIWINRD